MPNPIYPYDGKQAKKYTGGKAMKKARLVPIRCKVTPMTAHNLRKLAKMAGYNENLGKVVDQLTRNYMMSMSDRRN